MKKLFALFLLMGILIQCSTSPKISEIDQRKTLEAQYKVPTFSSMEIQDFAYEFIAYFNELEKAKKENNDTKLAELEIKLMNFNEKSREIGPKMTTEDVQKFTDWSTSLLKDSKFN